MAYYGLSNPYMAKFNPETETYSDGFKCGKAISTNITPNYSTASLYADNAEAERVDEFVNATVEVGTDRLPAVAAEILFGHSTDGDGSIVKNMEDVANYVGYGFYQSSMEDGVKKYQACIVCKVKFTEGQTSYQTKGENITFQTPNLTGAASAKKNGDWLILSPEYTNISETIAWLKNQLGIEIVYTAVSPAANANPKANGWFEASGSGSSVTYTLTTDTTVDETKVYYAAS